MNVVWRAVGFGQELPCRRKPQKLTVEAEVQDENSSRQLKDEVFSVARNLVDDLIFCKAGQPGRLLGLCRDGMKNMNAADFLSTNEGAQSPRDSFYFGKFRHRSF